MTKKETSRKNKARIIKQLAEKLADELPEAYIDDLLSIMLQYMQLLARWRK